MRKISFYDNCLNVNDDYITKIMFICVLTLALHKNFLNILHFSISAFPCKLVLSAKGLGTVNQGSFTKKCLGLLRYFWAFLSTFWQYGHFWDLLALLGTLGTLIHPRHL